MPPQAHLLPIHNLRRFDLTSTSAYLRRRNEIVSLNLVVNCLMLMFATVSAVTGAFGMNFNTWMPQDHNASLVR